MFCIVALFYSITNSICSSSRSCHANQGHLHILYALHGLIMPTYQLHIEILRNIYGEKDFFIDLNARFSSPGRMTVHFTNIPLPLARKKKTTSFVVIAIFGASRISGIIVLVNLVALYVSNGLFWIKQLDYFLIIHTLFLDAF